DQGRGARAAARCGLREVRPARDGGAARALAQAPADAQAEGQLLLHAERAALTDRSRPPPLQRAGALRQPELDGSVRAAGDHCAPVTILRLVAMDQQIMIGQDSNFLISRCWKAPPGDCFRDCLDRSPGWSVGLLSPVPPAE